METKRASFTKDGAVDEVVAVEGGKDMDTTHALPENLRHLSQEELTAMEKRIVRKADLLIL